MMGRILELLAICLMALATIYSAYKITEIEENRLKELQRIERYMMLERQSNWVKAQIKLNHENCNVVKEDSINLYE